MRIICVSFAIGFLMAIANPSMAGCSGLVVIPTAETLGANEYAVDPIIEPGVINTEIGLGERFEMGMDVCASEGADSTAYFNAKYLLHSDKARKFCLAGGINNLEKNSVVQPYLVATKEWGFGRMHFGGIRMDQKHQWFAGFDKGITERLSLMADHVSGDESQSSLSLDYQFNDILGVSVGAELPNITGKTVYSVEVTLSPQFNF